MPPVTIAAPGRIAVGSAADLPDGAPRVRGRHRLFHARRQPALVVDCAGVPNADSAGLAVLIEWRRWARAARTASEIRQSSGADQRHRPPERSHASSGRRRGLSTATCRWAADWPARAPHHPAAISAAPAPPGRPRRCRRGSGIRAAAGRHCARTHSGQRHSAGPAAGRWEQRLGDVFSRSSEYTP